SGTKLAMEDSIALAQSLGRHRAVPDALAAYEAERRPQVESTQRAAQTSLEWFEETERYVGRLEPIQFAVSLLTRSLRISHENLKVRDPGFVATVDRWFAATAANQSGVNLGSGPGTAPPPPMFTPFRLRELVLPNRVVVSPMCQYSAEDGLPNDWHLVHLGSRAIGGAGLIITEMTDISRAARISPGCTGMYKPEHAAAWRRITDFVHANSPAKIGVQLAHAGRKGSTRLMWEGIDEPLEHQNWPIISASPLPYLAHSQVPKAMDRADMDQVRDDFVRAVGYAEAAGFDLIELHFAHGYLLSSFLSPLTNRRGDQYGGSLDNRARFPLEVFDAVRAAWPAAKPISVRISATDWVPGGFEGPDAVALATRLKAHGCDIVDVSTGQTTIDAKPVYGRLYQTPYADRVRHEAGIATMTVGNIASYADVNSILVAGRADLCVLARAHLFDPYWTRHAATEQGYALPWPNQYGSVAGYQPRFK
ncbi:MAG: bifunctional salicylyl-CoA 5-hydroxylase/oxidoreductase, partial [Proteobacteria bacterium]|nr:bifunctional salicylyl-CoA 5-hydroxylase/oxidoreductase [Pseudomonadota bacterium]